jgi:phage terminase small subunit
VVSKLADELSANELRFCREYVACRNQTKAYLKAYGTEEKVCTYATAQAQSSKLMKREKVKKEIEALSRSHGIECGIDAKKILTEYAAIAFFDQGDLYSSGINGLIQVRDWDNLNPMVRRVIKNVHVKKKIVKHADQKDPISVEILDISIEVNSKMEALKILSEHLGLTKDSDAIRELVEKLITMERNSASIPAGSSASGNEKITDNPA